MKRRRISLILGALFLIVAACCGLLAMRSPSSGVRIPVHCENGKVGFIDDVGRMVIAPVWDSATPFGSDDRALVSITEEAGMIASLLLRWRLRSMIDPRTLHFRIDRQGNLTPSDLPRMDPWQIETKSIGPGEMALIERGGEYRWILEDGNPAFGGSWQQAKDFQGDDPAAVLENRRWGFINRKGERILPCRWDDTLGFDGNGNACVLIGKKWGVIDREGRLVVPLRFESLAGFDDQGFSAAELFSGWGFIDRSGAMLIPFRYDHVEPFDRFGMAKIQLKMDRVNPLSGWIDRDGKSVIEARYEAETPVWAPNFTDHPLLPVIESGSAGLIDRKGRTVVAKAHGELMPVVDPSAPDKYWITTIPYRSMQAPDARTRPPFQPQCHDSSGVLIWNGDMLTKAEIHAMCAAISGLLSAVWFIIGRRAAGQFPQPSARPIEGSG